MPETIWVDEARGFWTGAKHKDCVVEYVQRALIDADTLLAIEDVPGFGYGSIGLPHQMLNDDEHNPGWPSCRGYAAFYSRK
jgi:hypothetical protein